MPRNESGVYALPPGTEAVTGTTISSSQYNTAMGDLEADLNVVRPVSAGGTGATTIGGLKAALDKRDVASLTALMTDATASYPTGTIFTTRAEGYSFEVVTSDPDRTTAGGVMLRVLNGDLTAYGAAGDNVTNDTAAVVRAFGSGKRIDGKGRTYLVDPLTVIPTAVGNLTLRIRPEAGDALYAWDMSGPAFEASKPITGALVQGQRDITCPGHGFSIGDVVLIESNQTYETINSSRRTYWTEVQGVIDANTFTAAHVAPLNISSGQSARASRLPWQTTEFFGNVRIVGTGTQMTGLRMIRLTAPSVENMTIEGCAARGVQFWHCYKGRTRRVESIDTDLSGYGTGLGSSGCGYSQFGDTYGHRNRHCLSFGSAGDIIDVGSTFGHVEATECLSAPFDTHPGALDTRQRSGKVIGELTTEYAGEDGIVIQGAGCTLNGVHLSGRPARHLCLIQLSQTAGAFTTVLPDYHIPMMSGRTQDGRGVNMSIANSAAHGNLVLGVNAQSSQEAILVDVGTGSLETVTIDGTMQCTGVTSVVNIQQSGGGAGFVRRVAMRGKATSVAGTTGTAALRVNMSDTNPAPRCKVAIAGSDLFSPALGIRLFGRTDAFGLSAASVIGTMANSNVAAPATLT